MPELTCEGYAAYALRSPASDLEATFVPGAGMVGASLRHHGQELLGRRRGVAAYAATGDTMGIPLLHPWANRLSKDEYEAAGGHGWLAPAGRHVSRDEHGLPIHGLYDAGPWHVREARPAHLSADLQFADDPDVLAAFPFPHRVTVDVRLDDAALRVRTTVIPLGDHGVPIAFGYHPYLRLPGVPRARWRLRLPAMRRLELDARGIPTGRSDGFPGRSGPLGDVTFDDCFVDVPHGAAMELEGGGRRITLRPGDGYPVAQVYAPEDDDVVALEPMTAPVDALVSGRGLVIASPHGAFTAGFAITVEDA